MKINRKWASGIGADGNPIYAPKDAIVVGGRLVLGPKDKHYKAAGYKRVIDSPPSNPAPKGYHYEAKGWEEQDETITRRYEAVADPLPTVADFDFVMEEHLRTEREARGYTTREPDAYIESSNPRWRQDAHEWVAHRDAVMEYALALINAVESGTQEPPTMAEFIAGLPQIVWTYTEGY